MKDSFFKFPSTPHLAAMPGVKIRDDKILTESEREILLTHVLTIEEKVDGANLGLSFDADGNTLIQNRGEYLHLPGQGQWKHLNQWLAFRTEILFEYLTDRYILFGEWCYAQHSIFYDRLPDWFLGFDIYDKNSRRFLSTQKRNQLLSKMLISKVPYIAHGRFTCHDIFELLSQSKLTDQIAEGIYLRMDHGNWLEQRAKLVRPGFVQAIQQHWSRCTIRPNRIKILP